ncbi:MULTISPECIES: leucyl/phenylalanyl-tRNA--protein transferase [unclassified Ruegeria]|uniref:leucyl/phenylalanyl-tRNA--protein transferase n=1 Tax=unclassified Ruegeria TaxID=2625375 RepID=UPI001ADD496F|nr:MULTISPECIES: leucyl/phenylalanyl-tRNA--protein transferase [unclassified Ruegeria]MBO9410142.1 leucyl/phenylalanyl-tRNA--protein transferase [Ruegeria sp. R8_1]MBO9414639.1 leucyl/phenylalanyl-tRNA--protein transferase [Ruegeria sp. R8_2]
MSLTPDLLLHGYSIGIFPMAEHRDDPELFWVDPKFRGVFPLDGFHISRSLARRIRNCGFSITINRDFAGVVDGCADRADTWINDELRNLYQHLHHTGHAHSLEVWEESALIGGVYGVCLGAAFFGESMFSRRTDASKIALAYLTDRLRRTGFHLFDTQFLTAHLASLGAIEIPRTQYRQELEEAISASADFTADLTQSPDGVIQRITQTS